MEGSTPSVKWRGNSMYEVEFTETAKKQFKMLEKSVRDRIISSLKRIRIRPETFVKRLVGKPFYSLRVGNYRIIVDIKNGKLIILVLNVAHRRNIYKKIGKDLLQYHLNDSAGSPVKYP